MKGLKAAIKWIVAIVVICAVLVALASVNGLNVERTIIKVNGNEISENEYKFYVEMAKSEVLSEQGIADEEAAKEFLKNGKVGEKSAADYIKDKALENITKNEVGVIKAIEAGISLTEEEKDAARNTSGMEEQIKETYNVSLETYADVMEKSRLIDKYYQSLSAGDEGMFAVTDDEVKDKLDEAYALVQHVLIKNTKEDGSTDDNFKTEAKKKAEEVLAKAVAGNNFEALITEYGEDPGMENSPEGYLITETGYTLDGQSQMVEPFTKGSFAVDAGNVNPELVESEYGWHIIKRCVIPETHADYTSMSGNARTNLSYDKFSAYLESLKAGVTIEANEKVIGKIKVVY